MRSYKPLTLAAMLLLSACGTPKRDILVASCPLPPLIPAALREVPPEATVDIEDLILKALSGSEW